MDAVKQLLHNAGVTAKITYEGMDTPPFDTTQDRMQMDIVNYDIDTAEGMQQAVAWTERLFNRVADGGVWAIPRSGTILQLFHSGKRAVVMMQHAPDPSIDRVLAAMGWTVERTP